MSEIQPLLQTPRLTLLRLTNPSPASPHLHLFHENWTDPAATAWSVRGMSRSLEHSREWMVEHLEKYDNLFYAVFVRGEGEGGVGGGEGEGEGEGDGEDGARRWPWGTHIGSVSLRRQLAGPAVPPPSSNASSTAPKPLNLRVLGYGLFAPFWGQGYATEACRALLSAYSASIAAEKALGNEDFYVEAGVDEGNPGSRGVIGKLGLQRVGFKREEEPVFLAGEWRTEGYWIYGMYL